MVYTEEASGPWVYPQQKPKQNDGSLKGQHLENIEHVLPTVAGHGIYPNQTHHSTDFGNCMGFGQPNSLKALASLYAGCSCEPCVLAHAKSLFLSPNGPKIAHSWSSFSNCRIASLTPQTNTNKNRSSPGPPASVELLRLQNPESPLPLPLQFHRDP